MHVRESQVSMQTLNYLPKACESIQHSKLFQHGVKFTSYVFSWALSYEDELDFSGFRCRERGAGASQETFLSLLQTDFQKYQNNYVKA